MDLESIRDNINKLSNYYNLLITYMRNHNLNNSGDLENKLGENSEEEMMNVYKEFTNEIENINQSRMQAEIIKSERVFNDYGVSEDLVNQIISLITEKEFELKFEDEKSSQIEENSNKLNFYNTNDRKNTLDDYIPTSQPPQERMDEPSFHLLKETTLEVQTKIISEISNDKENNNNKSRPSDEDSKQDNKKEILYTHDEENEIMEMPENFIKHLKYLEFLVCDILNSYKNLNEANKILRDKIRIFEDAWNKFDEFYCRNKINKFDDADKLKKALKKELFENWIIIDVYNILLKLKIKVIPLDMKKLKLNYEMSIKAAGKITGKNVVALLGNSNAGKSTSTFYLAGSDMRLKMINGSIPHIYAESFIYPELNDICISYKALSETRYVVAFQINYEDLKIDKIKGSIHFADLPGLFENRDIETEISNNLGVTKFLKACKSLKILYVLNYKDMVANNCQGVRDLINVIISLVSSVECNIDKFIFAINKATKEEYDELIARIKKLEEHLTEAEKANKNFVRALKKVSKHIKDESFLINPLDKEGLENIHEKINDCNSIDNPGDIFRLTLSTNAKSVLREYVSSKEKFILNALENADKSVLISQMEEMSFFNELEELKEIQDRIQEIYSMIKLRLNGNYLLIEKLLNDIKKHNGIFSQNQIEDLVQTFKKIEVLDQIRFLLPLTDNDNLFKYSDAKKLIDDFILMTSKVEIPSEERLDIQFLSDVNKKLINMYLLTFGLVEFRDSYKVFHRDLKTTILKKELLKEYKNNFTEYKYQECYRYFLIINNLDKIISYYPSDFSEKYEVEILAKYDLDLNLNDQKETELSQELKADIKSNLEENLHNICELFMNEAEILNEEKINKIKKSIEDINKISDSKIIHLFEKNIIKRSNEKIGTAAKTYIKKRTEAIDSMIKSNENLVIDNLLKDYQSLKSISEIEKIANLVWESYNKTCEILKTILGKIKNESNYFLERIIISNNEEDSNNIIFTKNVQSLGIMIKMVDKSMLIPSLDSNFKENYFSFINEEFEKYKISSMSKSNYGNNISFNETFLSETISAICRLTIINNSEISTVLFKEKNFESEINTLEAKLRDFIVNQKTLIDNEFVVSNLRLFKNNFKKRVSYLEKLNKITKANLLEAISSYNIAVNDSTLIFKKFIFKSIENVIEIFKSRNFTNESIDFDCNKINLGYECFKEMEEIKAKTEYTDLFTILNENENYNLENYNGIIYDLKQYFSRSLQNNNINVNLNVLRNINEVLLERLVPYDQLNFISTLNLPFAKLYDDCFEAIRSSIPIVESSDKEKIIQRDFRGLAESFEDIKADSSNPINQRREREIISQLNIKIRNATEKIYNNLRLVDTDYLTEENIREIEENSKILNEINQNLEKYIKLDELKTTPGYTSKKIKKLFDDMKEKIMGYFQASQFANAENILKKLALYTKILENVQDIEVNFNEIKIMKEDLIKKLQINYKNIQIKNYRNNQPKKIFDQLNREELITNVTISNYYDSIRKNLIEEIENKYTNEIEEILNGKLSFRKKEELLEELEKSTDYLPDEIKNHEIHQIQQVKNRLINDKKLLISSIDELIKDNNYEELNDKFDKSWPSDLKAKLKEYLSNLSKEYFNELTRIFEEMDYENFNKNLKISYDFFEKIPKLIDLIPSWIREYKKYLNNNIKNIFKTEKEFFNILNLEFNTMQYSDISFIDTYNSFNSNNNSMSPIYFIVEFIKILNEKPIILESFAPELQSDLQFFLKSTVKSLQKLEDIYQLKLGEEILSAEYFYGIYKKIKDIFSHSKVLNTEEITKILYNDEKNHEFIIINSSFKSPETRLKEFEVFIFSYKEEILKLSLFNEKTSKKDEKCREQFFKSLANKINSCKFFFTHLGELSNIDQIENSFKSKVNAFNSDVLNFDISSTENLGEEKLNEINLKILILKQISYEFPNYMININNSIENLKQKIIEFLKTEKEITFQGNMDLNLIKSNLVKSKKICTILRFYEKEVEENILDYINELKSKDQPGEIFNRLGQLLQDDGEYGFEITRIHKVFDGFQNSLYKSLTEKFGIEYTLHNLNLFSITEEFILKKEYSQKVKDFLNEKYNEYFTEFKSLIETHLRNSLQGMIFIKDQLSVIIAGEYIEDREEKIINPNLYSNIPKILAHICAIFTINGSKNYYNMDDTRFEDKNLLIPHPAQIIAIFEIFCLHTRKSELLKNNLAQVGTGEGKSIILGLVSILFALFGYEVSVACYSFNLSKRDYDSFKELFDFFGVANYIHYGNFNYIMEKILNKNVNLKKYLSEIIFNKNDSILAQMKGSKRFQVLLFDEVDIFFSKEFHGKIYSSSLVHKHKTIIDLFEFIWNQRNIAPDEFLNHIKNSDQYIECRNIFNDWNKLLDETLKDILNDLYNFESHQYFAINNKIGYKDNDQVVYNIRYGYKTVFAYFKEFETGKITRESLEENIGITIKCSDFSFSEIPKMFDYIFGVSGTVETLGEGQKKMIADEYNIRQYTILPSIFGRNNLQFNKQTNFFIEIDNIKKDFIVNENSDGDKFLEDQNNNNIKVVEKVENKDIQYFYRITEEIKRGLIGQGSSKPQRAVLVIFKDLDRLNNYLLFNSLSIEGFNIISESLNDKEVQDAIKSACRKGVVTLATASFGRGYDFIIRDKSLNAEGGLHVIQAFLSDDMAEQIQIMGRTARQGNTGSYSLIVQYEDIKKKYEITKESLEIQICKYDYIMKIRNVLNELIFNNNQSIIEQVKQIHSESTKLLEYIKNNEIEKVKKQIYHINKGVNFSKFVARTKIYLDATSSMEILIDKLRYVIKQIFIKLTEILKKNDISENSFSIEIVLFRNYDVSKENILVPSGWEMKPDNLVEFLTKAQCLGGWEKEAIELCLYNAVKETKNLTNIIIFSDSASNNKDLTRLKRSHNVDTYTENCMNPLEYWNNTEFKDVIDVEEELIKIKEKKIPIYGFYVENKQKKDKDKIDAQNFFRKISNETNGLYQLINVEIDNETNKEMNVADKLAKLISEPIIKAIGENIGDDEKMAKLIKEFERQYV